MEEKPKYFWRAAGGALLSAALLSIPFLLPVLAPLALIGFVPLLLAGHSAREHGLKSYPLLSFLCFLVWNLASTFWVCNATFAGGLFASFANALQMFLVFSLFRLSLKTLRNPLPYIFLPAAWTAWEKAYFSVQISWPWLTLGHAFAGTPQLIQWYEFTGTLGGTLWIWMCNISIYALIRSLRSGLWKQWTRVAKIAAPASLALLLVVPCAISLILWDRNAPDKDAPSLDVLIAQPNIDPYHKFQALNQNQQNAILEGLLINALEDRSDSSALLILTPETFCPDVEIPAWEKGEIYSPTASRFSAFVNSHPGTGLLLGASSRTFYLPGERPSWNARKLRDGSWAESHNSALMLNRGSEPEIFHKNKLVPGVEMMPYPRFFSKIDDALGGVFGRNTGNGQAEALTGPDGKRFGCAICYESIYGDYCADYIRRGEASYLAIITNDAWWGDTPGFRQHLNYARLRAIETRRDIARCANTGISAFINSRGEITSRTQWWEIGTLRGKVALHDGESFFVANGDVAGRVSTLIFFLLLAIYISRLLMPGSLRK